MPQWSTILWRHRQGTAGVARGQVMESNGVVLDGPRRRVQVDGYVVHLSARETAVLRVLMARTGRVVYGPSLAITAWGTTRVEHGAVDRLLGRLRRRIEPSPVSPARLRRIDGAGYIFGSAPAG
jgi:DNA-binding response OmpR family regulator